jgi:acid phosphatase type 7
LTVSFGACVDPNSNGNIAATKTGDVSNPPAPRLADATAELAALCGPGAITETGAENLRRTPYLQQVGQAGAHVVWTTVSEAGARVRVSTPDEIEVLAVDAEVDETAPQPTGRQMVARLEGLLPGTVYCYEVEEDDILVVGKTGFRTAPAEGEPVRFIAFGDSGDHAGSDQMALLSQLGTVPLDFIVHVGDIAYEDGSLGQFEESFFAPYAPLLRHFPVFPVAGNHEYHTDDAAAYCAVYDLPNNERWYSYDWGDVHFVGLDTERTGDEQFAWLEADLAATTKPWKVVYMHRPLYSSSNHGSDLGLRAELVPIFEAGGVQLVLAGHDHNYERATLQRGIAYVVTGGGGRGTYGAGTSDFTAFSEAVIHFLYIEVQGDSLALHAIDAVGREFDSLVLRL